MLFGGSWGATLAIAYTLKFRKRVHAMILRGPFLGTVREVEWLYGSRGAAAIFPEIYSDLASHVNLGTDCSASGIVAAYHDLIVSATATECSRKAAVLRWTRWEIAVSRFFGGVEAAACLQVCDACER